MQISTFQRSPSRLSAEPEHSGTAGPYDWLISRFRDLQRSPSSTAIREAYLAPDNEDPLDYVFKEAGVVSWMIYYCAKSCVKSSVRSNTRTETRDNLENLRQSSSQHQREIAERVPQHLQVEERERIQRWHHVAMTKDNTTGRTLRADRSHSTDLQTTDRNDDMPSTPNSTPAGEIITTHPRKRRYIDFNDGSTPHATEDVDRRPTAHLSSLLQAQEVPGTLDASNNITEDSHIICNALLSETSLLYPVYLAGAIRRITNTSHNGMPKAAVSMTFPTEFTGLRVGCQMHIEIEPNKIEHIAWELFDAHFETDGSVRYLYLSGGSKVFGQPDTVLRGCRMSSILPMFGDELTQAISASPMCLDDFNWAHHHTDAVSMIVSCEAQKPATLMLSLDLKHGTDIANKIYKS